MSEPILFPDVEEVLVKALPGPLGVSVSTKVPNPRPSSFVVVKRLGGNVRQIVTDASLVKVECWADEEDDAADLVRLTRAYVLALAGQDVDGDFVRKVREIAGPQSFPDPISESARYTFTAQIETRGVAL